MSPFHRWYNNRRAGQVGANGGWYMIGGKTYYFKSRFEVLVACHWQYMVELKIIHAWWYEPYLFKFEKKRGITEYCPDFEISHKNLAGKNENLLVEAKGYPNTIDIRKMRQFHKDYPNCKLMLMVQNLQALLKSVAQKATEGRQTSLDILDALQTWIKNDGPIIVSDWTKIRKTNKYGLGLLSKATKVEKPVGGKGYNQRQKLNRCLDFRLPHEPVIDDPGAS